MKIIQTNYNSNDFQSRVITVKENLNWENFCDLIINCKIGECIRDEDILNKSEPLFAGVLVPRHRLDGFEVMNRDKFHLRVSFYLYNGMNIEALFYLLEDNRNETNLSRENV